MEIVRVGGMTQEKCINMFTIYNQFVSFNWNHFEMRLLNLRINFYLLRTFCLRLGSVCVVFFFHYVSAKFHLWPSSGDLPRSQVGIEAQRIEALSLYGSR